jgi:hypothetical protein
MSRSPACGANSLNPNLMAPSDRRAELCRILALGLIRLRMRDAPQVSARIGESSLHSPADQCRHAPPTHRRTA